jgi:RNA polymerase sigma-70 factor (ECF subfamily)
MMFSAAGVVDAVVASRASRLPMTESAFLDFYARTSAPLMRYLRRLTGSGAVAEDLLQETYLRLLSQVRVPGDEDHRRNYLFKIATNLARDHFRREKRYRQAPDDGSVQSGVTLHPAQGAHAPADVWGVLEKVTARDRELLLLAYVEGLTHAEISEVTGLMRASLKPLLFRARRRFAAALADAGLAPELSAGVTS